MNIESTLYYRHADLSIMRKIDALLTQHHGDTKTFRQLAKRIHTSRGHVYANEFMHGVFDLNFDVYPQSIAHLAGFSIVHFQHGRYSQEILHALMLFLKKLIPDLHIQAWAYSPHDSCEFWLKFDDSELICAQDQPHIKHVQGSKLISSIYPWWHANMPKQIHEGILNEHLTLQNKH